MQNLDPTQPQQTPPAPRPLSRRAFHRTTVAAGLGAVGGAFLAQKSVSAQAITDTDILNFALNLEYLEAEFYTKVLTGGTIADFGIDTGGVGNEGPTTGGRQIGLTDSRPIIEEIAGNERDHVRFLREALGPAAVAKPAINLDALGAFNTGGQFLVLARAFEDVGVSAYGGAAGMIQDPNILVAAARIALTEAYHAGNIRLLTTLRNVSTQLLDEHDRLPPPSGNFFFTTSEVGLAKIRRPSLVLAILYGSSAAGTTMGGFFPDGVNGTINTV